MYVLQSTALQKLLKILRYINQELMTLPTFLEELFQSEDPEITHWTGQFYEVKGTERVLKIWNNKLRGSKWEAAFVNSAVDVVVARTLKHLESNNVRKGWRLPHSKVTEQKVADFFLDDFKFLHRYAEGAPYLTRLLKGLLREDVPNQELSAKAVKRRRNRKPATIQNALRSLTKDAMERIKEAVTNNDWYIMYDNINIANKHQHQRVDKRDTFDNGTAATLILLPSDNDKPAAATPALLHPENTRPEVTADLFFPSVPDGQVLRQVSMSHVFNTIMRSLPEGSTTLAIPIVPIEQLPLKKTALFPLQTMKIDESTIAGNLAVLERLTMAGLQLPKSWFDDPKSTIIAGDQMTVSRLLTLKIHRVFDPDPYHSLAWVQPTLQLFHLVMNLCGTIFRTHMGTPQFPGTLASIVILMGRKRLTKDKQEFRDADEHLRIVFDSTVLLLCEALRQGSSNELDIRSFAEIITDFLSNDPSPSHYGLPSTTANSNALLFLRDMTVYIELSDAVKTGDISCIRHVLPVITLMMHGGGNKNYALELLRLLYGIRYLWTDEWTKRVLASMLVNPKGVVDGWMATDMLQENHNYLIKAIFSAKGSNMSWEYLRDSISTNIRTFQNISRMFEREVGIGSNSTQHKKPSTAKDISKVQGYLKGAHVLCNCKDIRCGESDQRLSVVDLQRLGGYKMSTGAVTRFLSRQHAENTVDLAEMEGLDNIEE
ncbi:hypothetical protein BGZ81_002488 [Podila clonocystis]|nr:hypothetical protein BGZ81_002488 [Podila clonocystis]